MASEPERLIARYWMPALIGSFGTVVAAVSAVIAASAIGGHGGSTNPTPLLSGTENAVVQTNTATPVFTAPAHAIVAGDWTLQYNILSNDCGFGPDVGTLSTLTMTFDEAAPDDEYVHEGEEVDVKDQGYDIGLFQFTYPYFSFQEPLTQNGYDGTATISITFQGSDGGHGSRTETYTDGQGGSCTIAASN